MIRYLLDTDHVSLHERGHPPLLTRLAAQPPGSIAVSVVTVEEAIRGRLAVLARRSRGEARVRAYAKFEEYRQRADAHQQRAERLAAQLKALGIEPEP
jgi:tRNA(fMet)-specific endonuclease VapC